MKNRVKEFVKSQNMTVSEFEKSISASNGYVNSITKSIGLDKLKLIIEGYPILDVEWLLTGNGRMLKKERECGCGCECECEKGGIPGGGKLNKERVPLIPVDAVAGFASEDVQVCDYELNNYYVVPEFQNKGVRFLVRTSGSSMYPKYSNGDILACRPITDVSFIQWGKVYVLDTEQGPLVKRLFECKDDPEKLECHSDNKQYYPPFLISKESIRKMYIVVGVIRLE